VSSRLGLHWLKHSAVSWIIGLREKVHSMQFHQYLDFSVLNTCSAAVLNTWFPKSSVTHAQCSYFQPIPAKFPYLPQNRPQMIESINSTGPITRSREFGDHKNSSLLKKRTLLKCISWARSDFAFIIFYGRPDSQLLVLEPVHFINLKICGRLCGKIGDFGWNRPKKR
jgi:hypothetical protein